jgi:hypothetical protein
MIGAIKIEYGVASLEYSLSVSNQFKHMLTISPSSCIPKNPKRNENLSVEIVQDHTTCT